MTVGVAWQTRFVDASCPEARAASGGFLTVSAAATRCQSFILLYSIVWVSLTLFYLTEVRGAQMIGNDGIMVRPREAQGGRQW
jgi:hypothetical protein